MKHSDFEDILIRSNPSKYLPKFFSNIEDIFDNMTGLSYIEYDEQNRDRLVNMLCDYILLPKRNKKAFARKSSDSF